MQDFKTLVVWQKAHELTLKIYKITKTLPSDERFGLISQMQRSASSIPTNIAEGCWRETNAELARFLHISMGSASELPYQVILSHDVIEVKRMLTSLIKKLK